MSIDMRERFIYVALLLTALGVAAFFYKRYHVPPHVDIPSIAVTDLSGQPISLSAYRGRPLFLSFFASWCGPCMREMPDLAALHDTLREKKLSIICISDDPMEKLQTLQAIYGDRLTFLHTASLHDIGIYTYPTNYIYDALGRKIYDQVNPDHWTDPALIKNIKQSL